MEKERSEIKVEGMSDYIIKEKLNILKYILIRWNKDVFGWYDLKVENGWKTSIKWTNFYLVV